MKTFEIVFERGEGEWWGRIEGEGFLVVGTGPTTGAAAQDALVQLADLQPDTPELAGIDLGQVELLECYDVQGLFEAFNMLKLGAVAKLAGLNESLVRQYAKGIKHPSAAQAKKIEQALHQLARQLAKVSVV